MLSSNFLGKKSINTKAKSQSTLSFGRKSASKDKSRENDTGDDGAERVSATPPINQTDDVAPSENPASEERQISPTRKHKQSNGDVEEEGEGTDDEPVIRKRRKTSRSPSPTTTNGSKSTARPTKMSSKVTRTIPEDSGSSDQDDPSSEPEEIASASEKQKAKIDKKKASKIQATLQTPTKDPYPDWKVGDPVPYAALCTTFSLIELTTKRLQITAYCSAFLQQVLRLTPQDLLPTVQLMLNKLAADYAGIELGIGESLIMKAIGESSGRSLAIIKADHQKVGDLGLVAAKSKSKQGQMFKPKALTVRGVHQGLLDIAKMEGHGSQDQKVRAINKLMASADVSSASKSIDIDKDKGALLKQNSSSDSWKGNSDLAWQRGL